MASIGFGALPNVQQFDTGGFFLSARGFDGSDNGTALFSKNGGTNEVGLLGLVDDPSGEDEITGHNFIQLNMDGLRTLLTNFKFSMNSVDNAEGWAVFGLSNDSTPFQFTLLASSGGFLDNGVHGLPDGWDNYNFFYSGGATGSSNVLLHSFSADIQAVLGPIAGAGLPGLFASLGGLFMLNRRRKRTLGHHLAA